MNTTLSRRWSWRVPLATLGAGLTALTLAAAGATAADASPGTTASHTGGGPVVTTQDGTVRGKAVPGGYAFRGLPYAAAPSGELRWRAPRPPAAWKGVRDATDYGPNCFQPAPTPTVGAQSEDCLYLNVSTPKQPRRHAAARPVLVLIHGGGLTLGAGRDYDPAKLAAEGTVVVTANYRLGALGFLAHPALASRPGGPAGNYGLMDQQAALRWIRHNIGRFGGNPHNVTIAGESAGGLSVLSHLTSPGSRGLFQRAIVQSGTFALNQQSLATAKAAGMAIANKAGCADQSATCLRALPAAALVNAYPRAAIPGVVDGAVLKESVGTALAAGRFARVPILNGSNHDEERLFLATGAVLHNGTYAAAPKDVTAENYRQTIASVLGVSGARSRAIAREYPLGSYTSPRLALSALLGDANFACTALQVGNWTSKRVPTFAYEFNDDAAPARYQRLDPPVATHASELPYLVDLPDARFQDPLNRGQRTLASHMRAAWAHFAASGNPSTSAVHWPSFHGSTHVLSLQPPKPRVEQDFATRHHCSFWVTH
ncbi:carboxylesterase/lipase family protein [Streptomyces sp. NPDC059718]